MRGHSRIKSPGSANLPIDVFAAHLPSHNLRANFLHRFALVVPATRACLMRLLHLMAMRTFPKRRLRQMIVSPARASPALGMASLWIGHRTTPCAAAVLSRCSGFFLVSLFALAVVWRRSLSRLPHLYFYTLKPL